MEKAILKNEIQCTDCMKKIRSFHRHDFKMCKCGKIGVDGGNSYLRRVGKNYIDLSIYSNGTFELEREWVLWGKNYDKDMNRLEETEWLPIKNLDTDHIYKILELNIPDSYRRLMEEEIIHRENKILEEYGL